MTVSSPEAVITGRRHDDLDELSHFWCCREELGMCGADLRGLKEDPDLDEAHPDMCVVCAGLTRCLICGEVYA